MKILFCPQCNQPIAALSEENDVIVLRTKKVRGAAETSYTTIRGATEIQCGTEYLERTTGGCGTRIRLDRLEGLTQNELEFLFEDRRRVIHRRGI